MLGMAERTYWDRESGVAVPDAEFLAKLREFGVDIWYVITGERMPLGTAQRRAAAYTPAERAAEEIHGMKLAEDDAEMVVSVAKRLSIQKR